jgi:N-acetylglucosaminyl-diphospho-decaprenol L-rhamnosyltransferase
MSRLTVIIVSWNVRQLLLDCLQATDAACQRTGLPYRITVVDNASADGTPAAVREAFPQVELIESGGNPGFGAANNLALRQLAADCEFVLLLNPDTVPAEDSLQRMLAVLTAHPETVAVGPLLRYGDGSLQSSRRRFPTIGALLLESTPLGRRLPRTAAVRRYLCDDLPLQSGPVEWLVGAALLVRCSAIAAAGVFDERFFLYSEELEWQWRLQWGRADAAAPDRERLAAVQRSERIRFVAEAEIVHREGQSSAQVPLVLHLAFSRSRLLLTQLWYGEGWTRLVRSLLRLGYRLEWAEETLKGLLGHRRELRRARSAVYRQLLREL